MGEFCLFDAQHIVIEGWEENQTIYLCDINNGSVRELQSVEWVEPTFCMKRLELINNKLIVEYEVQSIYVDTIPQNEDEIYLEVDNKSILIDFVITEHNNELIHMANNYSIYYKVKGILKKQSTIMLKNSEGVEVIGQLDFPLYELQSSIFIKENNCLVCLFGNALLLFSTNDMSARLAGLVQFEKARRLVIETICYYPSGSSVFFAGEECSGGYLKLSN